MRFKIKELREQKEMSQNQLSKLSGISRLTILSLENNEEHNAKVDTLRSLAEVLGVQVSELFEEEI